jgi:hypothetical protein
MAFQLLSMRGMLRDNLRWPSVADACHYFFRKVQAYYLSALD